MWPKNQLFSKKHSKFGFLLLEFWLYFQLYFADSFLSLVIHSQKTKVYLVITLQNDFWFCKVFFEWIRVLWGFYFFLFRHGYFISVPVYWHMSMHFDSRNVQVKIRCFFETSYFTPQMYFFVHSLSHSLRKKSFFSLEFDSIFNVENLVTVRTFFC